MEHSEIQPLVSVIKKEEELETCVLEKHELINEKPDSFHIKQEREFTDENQSSLPSEEIIEECKVDMISQDSSVKLESEPLIDENILKCESEVKIDFKENFIKSENEYEDMRDIRKIESEIVTKFSNDVTSDHLTWHAEEETNYIKKQKSSIGSPLSRLEKEENTESVLRPSENNMVTSIRQRKSTRSRKDNKSLVVQNECQSSTKHLSLSLGMKKKFKNGGSTFLYCSVCNKPFRRVDHMKKHIISVHHGIRFTCDICIKHFSSKYSLRSHINKHLPVFTHNDPHAVNRFTCDVCCKVFSSKFRLQVHVKIHNKKEYICEICNKCFSTKTYVKIHIHQVHSQYSYSCEVCFKTYNKISSYQAHVRIHSGNIYICDICNRLFVKKICLYSHMLGHLGLKTKTKGHKRRSTDVNCNLCSKSFNRTDHLKKHIMSIHYNSRFTCDICNKCFTSKDYLREHIQNHFLLFKCDACEKVFTDKNSLKLHKKQVHATHYICNVCNKLYLLKGSLIRHIQRH